MQRRYGCAFNWCVQGGHEAPLNNYSTVLLIVDENFGVPACILQPD